MNIAASDLSGCRAAGIAFFQLFGENVVLDGADLRQTKFVFARLIAPSFKGADLSGADFRWASLIGASSGSCTP